MIPSLLQIPSAVSDSKLHSVLPNNGKGDFQFDRSTGATRINKDGLIEEVGYFSSELVQNGNFSELGSELVTNGDFATDLSGWGISGNSDADHTVTWTSQGARYQSTTTSPALIFFQNVLTSGKTYKFTVDVAYTSGTIKLQTGSGADLFNPTLVEGTNTFYFTASNTQFLFIRSSTNVDVLIDNVSVKQVDPNDRWNLETGWSYGDNRLNFSGGSSNRACYSNIGITNGKTYKLSFNVLSISAGQVSLRFGGMAGVDEITATSTGIHSGIITANSSAIGTVQIEDNDNNFVGSITDVSIVEVQGDRPRLSYDITNGVVEDKPHLLLEPSSTNLVTFSEQLDNSDWVKSNSSITANQIISPNGSTTADLLTSSSGTSTHSVRNDTNQTVSIGNVISLSVFAKKGTYSIIQLTAFAFGTIYANFDLDNGAVGQYTSTNASIEDYGNGWYRCSLTATAVATSNSEIQINFVESLSSIRNSSYNATGTETIYLWGAQVEVQSYATSYIPTAGTTITRAAETCNNSKPSVNSTEGVLYCEIAALADDGTNRTIGLLGDSNNFIELAYRDSSNTIRGLIKTSGAVEANIQHTLSDSTSFNKIACKYKANDVSLYVNGQQVGVDTSASMPSNLNEINFYRFDVTEDFYGNAKMVAVFKEALSDTELECLTGYNNHELYMNYYNRLSYLGLAEEYNVESDINNYIL